ncbi:MAG TPA: malto-oligosyltrehalose trehalohydrolase [Stellaceae bacterium]|nr:malto-oligosyltrehalose trehalohydrolase [Stellaceae bacterium]
MRRLHEIPYGAAAMAAGVRFRLWAPRADAVMLRLEGDERDLLLPMEREAHGFFSLTTAAARPGTRYRYVIDSRDFPDPASRRQPGGAFGPSEVVDPGAHEWRDAAWRGRKWEEIVLYELHIGAFSEAGDFDGVAHRLDHIAELGATAIELMPVGEFAGRRNWGYDGVFLYAPASCYGPPEALKRLVEAAHRRGLAVLLDVVYNHFGPTGNAMAGVAPDFFRGQTPWGAAPDCTRRAVRDFIVENALYWLEEYHFDGLRLDAVDAIPDKGIPDIIDEIAAAAHARISGRPVHLILENDRNETRYLMPRGGCRAQWNDDLYHALHHLMTGERWSPCADFAEAPVRLLGRALSEGFAYQGEASAHRGGRPRGEPSAGLPATSFVAFLQNHDQIGNHPAGARIAALAPPALFAAGLATVLLAPQIPLLFMGEEWASASPFAFFCDFEPDLAAAVREARRRSFARFPEWREASERLADPAAPETFAACRLDWDSRSCPGHARVLALYHRLLAIRAREIVPRLAGVAPGGRYRVLGPRAVRVEWRLADASRLSLVANFAADPAPLLEKEEGRLLFTSLAGPVPRGFAPQGASFFLLEAAR